MRRAIEPKARRTSWPVSRILFPAAAAQPTAARRRPSIWTHRCRVPRAAYPQARASSPRTPARPHLWCGLLGLASGGVYQATPVTQDAGALLPHRFTLTTTRVAVCFLWHYPASHLGLLLAITLLCEVRTFLDSVPGPSDRHEPRPPGQLVRDEHGTRCEVPGPGQADQLMGSSSKPTVRSASHFAFTELYTREHGKVHTKATFEIKPGSVVAIPTDTLEARSSTQAHTFRWYPVPR